MISTRHVATFNGTAATQIQTSYRLLISGWNRKKKFLFDRRICGQISIHEGH